MLDKLLMLNGLCVCTCRLVLVFAFLFFEKKLRVTFLSLVWRFLAFFWPVFLLGEKN